MSTEAQFTYATKMSEHEEGEKQKFLREIEGVNLDDIESVSVGESPEQSGEDEEVDPIFSENESDGESGEREHSVEQKWSPGDKVPFTQT